MARTTAMKKNVRVCVLMTPNDKELLDKLAKLNNLDISSYVRHIIGKMAKADRIEVDSIEDKTTPAE